MIEGEKGENKTGAKFSLYTVLNLLICPSFNPGVGNRPVITYTHLSQVDRVT